MLSVMLPSSPESSLQPGLGEAPPSDALAIVVPTLNEAEGVGAFVRHLRAVAPQAELVVVDGGSEDATVERLDELGVRIVRDAGRGRAVQMNAGAAASSAPNLLFLHADTRLPVGVARRVAETLTPPQVAIGAFSLRLDSRSRGLALVELGIRLRTRFARMPYGDQALFLRREVFELLGGYRELDSFEDSDLVRRARRLGSLVVLPDEVVTSARRWHTEGVLRLTASNWVRTVRFLASHQS